MTIDARRLKLIHGLPTASRWRARAWSIAEHRTDCQPCTCPDTWLHSQCHRVVCPCARHAGDPIAGGLR